jgi:hypothetical protein
LSRTLPLHTGVFRRHFFSDTPIRSSQSSSEATLPDEKVRKPEDSHPIEEGDVLATFLKRKRRPRKSQLTEEEQAAISVSKLNLPPIDKWRQYFAIMEGQRLRFFLRNPDTARMLAEAYVPEGSKDLIVIEAAAGMLSYFFLWSW